MKKIQAGELDLGKMFKWQNEIYTIVDWDAEKDRLIVHRGDSTEKVNFNQYTMVEPIESREEHLSHCGDGFCKDPSHFATVVVKSGRKI